MFTIFSATANITPDEGLIFFSLGGGREFLAIKYSQTHTCMYYISSIDPVA